MLLSQLNGSGLLFPMLGLRAAAPIFCNPSPQPSVEVAKPGVGVAQPGIGVAQPSVGVAQPSVGVAQPSLRVAQPSLRVAQSSVGVLTSSSISVAIFTCHSTKCHLTFT